MGPVFYFSRKKRGQEYRNPKSKKGSRIVVLRTKQIIHRKKIFSRNTPPHTQLIEYFYLRKNRKVCLGFFQGRPPGKDPLPTKLRCQGRRRRRRPLFPHCAGCTKILAKLCATLLLDFLLKLCYNKYVIKREIKYKGDNKLCYLRYKIK